MLRRILTIFFSLLIVIPRSSFAAAGVAPSPGMSQEVYEDLIRTIRALPEVPPTTPGAGLSASALARIGGILVGLGLILGGDQENPKSRNARIARANLLDEIDQKVHAFLTPYNQQRWEAFYQREQEMKREGRYAVYPDATGTNIGIAGDLSFDNLRRELIIASNRSADEMRKWRYKLYLATAGSAEETLTYEEWFARESPDSKTDNRTQNQDACEDLTPGVGVPTLLVTDYSGTLVSYWGNLQNAFEKITELLNLHNLKGIIVNSEGPPYELVTPVEGELRARGIINFPFICMNKFGFDPEEIVRLAQSLGVLQVIYTDDQDSDVSYYGGRLKQAALGTGICVLPIHVTRPIEELVRPAIDGNPNAERSMEGQRPVDEGQGNAETNQPSTESEKKGFGSFLRAIFGKKN